MQRLKNHRIWFALSVSYCILYVRQVYLTIHNPHNRKVDFNFNYLIFSMDPAAETTHVVVWFTASRSVKGKSLVDLVPKSWIIQEGTRNFCLYPDESDYDKLDDWVKNSKLPVPTWSRSVVTIVKSAGKLHLSLVTMNLFIQRNHSKINYASTSVGYQQGLRRLQRSFENIDVVESSTDVESCSDVEAIKTKQVKTKSLKATAVKEAFNNIPPFPIDDNVEKTVEETEIIHHTSTKTKGSITAAEKKTLEVISSHSKEDTNSGASGELINISYSCYNLHQMVLNYFSK